MIPDPPLLIIARVAEDFDLSHFPWPEAAGARISVNYSKFREAEMLEVIVDGMAFLLSRFTAAETRSRFATEPFDRLFTGLPSRPDSAIGIAARDILVGARHLPEVNRRMLLLGKWIGEGLAATAAAWTPARRLASFDYFAETVGNYLAGGPFPTLFQTAISETRNGWLVTSGLHYFAGQEIRLTAPPAYSPSDIAERMVRIIDDIATHGHIDAVAQAKGMVEGEVIIFSPSDDLTHLDIAIRNDTSTGHRARK